MHRRGGKRIRLDDPPPEYENPMTPHHEQDYYGANSNYVHHVGEPSYAEQAGTSGTSSDGLFESPPTPGMGRRMTRSKRNSRTRVVKAEDSNDNLSDGEYPTKQEEDFQVEQIFFEEHSEQVSTGIMTNAEAGSVIVKNSPQVLVPVVLQEVVPVVLQDVDLSQSNGKDPEKNHQVRLMKNRLAARECRQKKKQYIQCLEERVAILENQNKSLMDELTALKNLYCDEKEMESD